MCTAINRSKILLQPISAQIFTFYQIFIPFDCDHLAHKFSPIVVFSEGQTNDSEYAIQISSVKAYATTIVCEK